MGKVSIRNRLRDNSGEDNTPQRSGDVSSSAESIITPTVSTARAETTTDFSNNVPTPNRTIRTEQPKISVTPEPTVSFSEPSFSNNNVNIPEPKIEPSSSRMRKPERQEQPSQNSNSLFKEQDTQEDNQFKGLFGGTKKLFSKKDEIPNPNATGEKQNLLDRLNVNKRMLYIALGTASMASILVISYLNSFSGEKLFGSEMVKVLVAKKDIPEKKSLEMGDLDAKEIPKKYLLKDAIVFDEKTDLKTIVGKIAVTDIYEDEQILPKKISVQEESPWLSPAVPVNHRAVTIPSRSLSYIKPKDHVDVMVSLEDPLDKGRKINTPILQNALVLAVDGKYKISQNDSETVGENITVAVPNKLMNVFSLLQDRGNFQLALRREGDTTNLDTKYSIAQMEVMLNTSVKDKYDIPAYTASTPKPRAKPKVEVEDPVVYSPPEPPAYRPQVYNPPAPRYVAPAYTPRKTYAAPKPANTAPKPVVNQAPPSTTTVTVINGSQVNQHKVNKSSSP